ncbi:MAG: HEAT repeat domain-containing protein [Planctomycetota bacterium]|nr:HEAT repeat domain-containing protein [Planctomycetota bacterium]
MSDERTCQNCGTSLKPAMLKCMDCGTRVNAPPTGNAATLAGRAGAANQNVRIVGASTATLNPPRIVGRQFATGRSTDLPPQHAQPATSHANNVSSAATRAQSPMQSANHSEGDSDEGLTSDGEQPADFSKADSRICECPCGARFRFPPHMAGMRRRCRKCRQPLVLPGTEETTSIPKAVLAADSNEVLKEAVHRAITRLAARESENDGLPGKTLSGKQLKEFASILEGDVDSSSQSAIDQRRLTILKLGRSKDSRAFELIEGFVDDSSKILRQSLATALGELGDRRGIRLNLQLLCDAEKEVVRESIRSLKVLADPIVIRPLLFAGLSDPSLRVQALEAVVGIGNSGLSELLEIVESRNPLTSIDAVTALGRIGDARAVPSLLMMLDHADAGLRATIVEALGRIGDRSALARIVALLSDPSEAVQRNAVLAVQKLPDRRAARPILAIIKRTQNADLLRQSVMALATTGSSKTVPTLKGLLANADAELQKAIAEALCRIDSPEATETLATMLRYDDLAVVTKALLGLRKHAVESAAPTLLQLCEHPNAGIRRHAVEALAETGQEVVFDILQQKLVSDSSVEVRTAAARSCGKVNDKRFVRSLEEALRDEPSVRSAALVSLAMIGDESSIPAMLASLHDSVPEVRYHAVTALGKLKADKATRAIKVLLEDESEMVRVGAISTLKTLGIQNARIPLSRRILKRASVLIPDRVAGLLPAGTVLAGAAMIAVICGLGWFFVSGSGGSVDNSIILAKAKPVRQAHWLPESSDLILLRNGGRADIWDGATGSFKSKVEVPELAESVSAFGMVSRTGDTMAAWAPDGYQADARTLKVPPAEQFGLSGDASVAVYLGKNRRVTIWDTREGKDIANLSIEPVPLPVLNSDGSVVAGEDKTGNIVLIDVATQTTIGDVGAAGNTKASENGSFEKMIFSSSGHTLAVLRTDRVVLCRLDDGKLSISEINEPVDPTVVQFPNESTIYSAWEASIVRLDLTTEKSKKWSVSNADLTINSLSISEDGSLAAVSAEKKKFGWVVNLTDGSTQELSPLDWPAE